MAQASIASIQAVLDTTAQGRGVRIVRAVRIATTASASAKQSIYIVPVVSYPGQAHWVDTSIASSATAIKNTIVNSLIA